MLGGETGRRGEKQPQQPPLCKSPNPHRTQQPHAPVPGVQPVKPSWPLGQGSQVLRHACFLYPQNPLSDAAQGARTQSPGKGWWGGGSLDAVRSPWHYVWQGRQGLIQAHPVHPGWECLPAKSNPSALTAQPSAKPSPTPSCSAGDGEGYVPGSWAPLPGVGVGNLHISLLLRNAAPFPVLSYGGGAHWSPIFWG